MAQNEPASEDTILLTLKNTSPVKCWSRFVILMTTILGELAKDVIV